MTLKNNDWPQVCRIVWLGGGIVAINKPGVSVQIQAGINGETLYDFQLSSYPSLFHILEQLGFTVIGATFIQDSDEMTGVRPPMYRAWAGSYLVSDLHQQWRQIAHAAGSDNKMVLMDISSRIASELMYCEMRLLNLSEAYSTQLRGRSAQDLHKEFERFKDMNSSSVYLAIHALFWELAVLRDNLAEFSAKFLFSFEDISTFSKLLKKLPENKSQHSKLAVELLTAGNTDGWLDTFSAYRNLFTHSAPMEHAAGIAFAIQDQMTTAEGLLVPQLYYALPSDIKSLKKQRSGGPLYKDYDALIAASSEKNPNRKTEPDALHYLHTSLKK